MTTLAQILGIESGVKSKAQKEFTALHRVATDSAAANGFEKTYQPLDDEGQTLPTESKKVQLKATDALSRVQEVLSRLVDVTYQKDVTNTETSADVVVNGEVILESVPGPHLLFLVKTLDDVRTFVQKLTVLSPDTNWHWDANHGLWASDVIETVRATKVQEALVLYTHTDKHPAQTMVVTKDVPVGTWKTIKYSGAISPERQRELLDRIDELQNAVKMALAKNNEATVDAGKISGAVFGYLFA